MFCNINTAPLSTVKSVASLLSAAEMLENDLPDISGSFITYAFMLCEDHFSKNPTNPIIDESFSELKDLSTISTVSSAKELEQFGDSILAAADDSPLPNEMYRLAYLSYAATSIHGSTSHRVNQKMKRIETKILPQANDFQNQNLYQHTNIQRIPTHPPTTNYMNHNFNNNFSLNGIPQQPNYLPKQTFSQPSQISDPSMITIPSYPKIESPHFDRIKDQAQNHEPNQHSSQKTNHADTSHPHPIQNQTKIPESQKKCKELVEIAKVAFKNGSLKVAYAAMAAAIKELEKKP